MTPGRASCQGNASPPWLPGIHHRRPQAKLARLANQRGSLSPPAKLQPAQRRPRPPLLGLLLAQVPPSQRATVDAAGRQGGRVGLPLISCGGSATRGSWSRHGCACRVCTAPRLQRRRGYWEGSPGRAMAEEEEVGRKERGEGDSGYTADYHPLLGSALLHLPALTEMAEGGVGRETCGGVWCRPYGRSRGRACGRTSPCCSQPRLVRDCAAPGHYFAFLQQQGARSDELHTVVSWTPLCVPFLPGRLPV